MSLAQFYGPGKFGLSFELFPPKTDQGRLSLMRHVDCLVEFQPSFITCTYGAGGSAQESTLEVISAVKKKHSLPVATHLTCVGRSTEQLRDYLSRASVAGIENVVALRGDPPQGEASFQPVAGGFAYANELVAFIHQEFPALGVAVGGYPEKHLEAPSLQVDLENLKRKVDAGAEVVLTQLFYDNRDYLDFRQRCEQLGLGVPVVPGLLPVTSLKQIQRIASLCGAKLPRELVAELVRYQDDVTGQFEVGVDFATRQTQQLIDAGVPGVHFYVLNKSEAAQRVLSCVNLPG